MNLFSEKATQPDLHPEDSLIVRSVELPDPLRKCDNGGALVDADGRWTAARGVIYHL